MTDLSAETPITGIMGAPAVAAPPAQRAVLLLGIESRFGHDVIDTLMAAGIGLIACVRSEHDSGDAGPYQNYQPQLLRDHAGIDFIVPLLTPGRRKLRVVEALRFGLLEAMPILHPNSVCSPSASFGVGSVLGPLVAISSYTHTGHYFMANRSAAIGHDCIIGDFCTIGPGTTLCGSCRLDDGVYVGAGAVICPNVVIGRNAVISAGSVVNKDVPPHTLVAGNPARVAKSDIAGYRGIGV